MSSAPPPFGHPGPPPASPELPEGIVASPAPPPAAVPPAAESAHRLPDFPWWGWIPTFVIAFAGSSFAAAVLAVISGADLEDLPTGVIVGATLVQGTLLVAMSVVFGRMGEPGAGPAAFGLRRSPFWSGLGWAFLGFMFFFLLGLAYQAVFDISEQDDLAKDLGAEESALKLAGVALLVLVVAPISEEFFFRGFMFQALWRRFGFVAGVVATGLAFGLVHAFGSPIVFLPLLAVLGAMLCLLFRVTGSLLPCIGLHAFNNAAALSFSLEWEAWQVLLTLIAAPTVVVFAVSRFSALRVAPAR
jgi:uncharacterized protein